MLCVRSIALFLVATVGMSAAARASITDVEAGKLIRLANERIAVGDTPADVEAWLASHMNAPAAIAQQKPEQPWDVYAGAAAKSVPAATPVDVWQRPTGSDTNP